jgi:septum formation protein
VDLLPDLVLASTSPYRFALMERLGVPFRSRPPYVDEEALLDPGLRPKAQAEWLAWAKAQSVAASEPESVVIGSDQMAALGGHVFGKPGSAARAVEQLLQMAGKPHELFTAVSVCHRGQVVAHTDVTTLWMRPLTRAEAERYVEADRPFDCAGSYKLESRGIALFERISSNDHTAVTGLPLIALTSILRDFGYAIP